MSRKKLKLKRFYFHPITTFILMTLLVIVFSAIFSIFEMQATYNTLESNSIILTPKLVVVENLLSFEGMKYIISNAVKNFVSFAPLGTLIISLIGLSVAESTGFLETITKKYLKKMPRYTLTFLIILFGTISSLINEVGYAILIPAVALIYFMNERNPLLGIVTAFCGVSFGYGIALFVGTMEISLIPYTEKAAKLVDSAAHVPLSGNLFFIIAATIIISIVGTIIIEKIISPKIGKYKKDEELAKTEQYNSLEINDIQDVDALEVEANEKRGLKSAFIVGIIVILLFIYALIPNLPYSGMLLDMEETTYANQLFGKNSYFQDGFTYIVMFFLTITSLAFGIGSKKIKNDKKIAEDASQVFSKLGSLFILMFVASQFIAIFKKTNIGVIITAWLANLLEISKFTGIPLIVLTIVLIGISNLFLTGSASKWQIFAPIAVPMFMQSNISAPFAQIIMRAGDSITNGFTPLLASFVIYIGYLNIYNLNKSKPYTIKTSLNLIRPYFLLIAATWILLIIGWYIIGLPIGPGIKPVL